jgi:hypothetical protein
LVQRERAKLAADELLAAALLGDCWAEGLQQLADAGGATLLHLRSGRPFAALSSTGCAEADVAMLAGRAHPVRGGGRDG